MPATSRSARDTAIIQAALNGASVADLAEQQHLSVQRINQILRTDPGYATHRAQFQARREDLLRAQAQCWSQQHPTEPVTVAAHDLGVPEQAVRRLVGERVSLHEPVSRVGERQWTETAIGQALVAFLEQVRESTAAAYTTMAAGQGWPSLGTVLHHGRRTWRRALAAAGYRDAPRIRRGRATGAVITDEELLGWVRRYLVEAPGPWAYRRLNVWLAEQPSAPAGSTMRRRLGGWTEILRRAQA